MTTHPTLYDVVRYSANVEVETENGRRKFQPLIGEEAGFLTVVASFTLARRPTVVNAFSGTGKTILSDAAVALMPEAQKQPWIGQLDALVIR